MTFLLKFCSDVDGGWSAWTGWSQCTKTCGLGRQYRYRSCDNPKPVGNGAQCPGDHRQVAICNLQTCRGNSHLYCEVIQIKTILSTNDRQTGKLYQNNFHNRLFGANPISITELSYKENLYIKVCLPVFSTMDFL